MNLPLPAEQDDLVTAWTQQPELFEKLDLAVPVVAGARDFLHSGKTTTRDAEAAAKIVAAAALGWSQRRIAHQLGHSRNTVQAVLRLAEAAGKVEPVKNRVLAAASEAVHQDLELGNTIADKIRTAVDSGEIPERALAGLAALRRAGFVGAGIVADKDAAGMLGSGGLAGGGGLVVNAGPGSVVQVVAEYGARIRALADSESGETSLKPAKIAQVLPEVLPARPEGTGAEAGAEARGRPGAGGVARAAGAPVSEPTD